MKKLSLITSCLSLIPTLVVATPVPSAPVSPPVCPCPKAFQGFYIGGSAGYGTGDIRLKTVSGPQTEKYKLSAQGFDGGLLLGYTYIFANKVGLGLDAYVNWASTQGKNSIADGVVPEGNASQRVSLRNAFQLRVPVSYVINDLVAPKIYVGWDNSRWVAVTNEGLGAVTSSSKARYNGVLWGAGVDFLLTKHLISGFEYTGVFSQSKTVGPQQPRRIYQVTTRPMYTTVKATLKVIY